ncbi:MAG: hypothetical protein HC927_01330 [Deltaproteobacteria bacterium]|nr:hypothetical protein [Deltaproteobacteria bacterium]
MRSSPLSLIGMFLLGACATVAVQSSAAPTEGVIVVHRPPPSRAMSASRRR